MEKRENGMLVTYVSVGNATADLSMPMPMRVTPPNTICARQHARARR